MGVGDGGADPILIDVRNRSPNRWITSSISRASWITRRAGATGLIRCRLDSAFYTHKVVAAIGRGKAQFSITARMDQAVQKAIAQIPEKAWTSIKYPQAIFDEEQQRWISDAQVAGTTYTAFTSLARKHHVQARLIVRRVKRLNPATAPKGRRRSSRSTVTTQCSPTRPPRC